MECLHGIEKMETGLGTVIGSVAKIWFDLVAVFSDPVASLAAKKAYTDSPSAVRRHIGQD